LSARTNFVDRRCGLVIQPTYDRVELQLRGPRDRGNQENKNMFGLTGLGIVHTLFSLVAVFTGAGALITRREIVLSSRAGKIYAWATVVTCLTGFGIFQHGGFGVPHVLGILTLLVLGLAAAADRLLNGSWARYVGTAAMTTSYFFHWIPGIVETTTRVPLSKPLIASRDAPALQMLIGTAFLLYLIGLSLQVWRIRRAGRGPLAIPVRA
jgi:hypothetical protein